MAKKKAAKKAAPRKRPLNNKGTKRSASGRHSFDSTPLAKELKAHNKYMPHGYEVRIHITKKRK